jgi:hypothetical protein
LGVRHYRGPPDTDLVHNYATVTWRNDNAAAPVRRKFYAKTEDLLRIEVCFDNREAVLLGVRWASLEWPDEAAVDGAGVADRLGVLALASALRSGATASRTRPAYRPSFRLSWAVPGLRWRTSTAQATRTL